MERSDEATGELFYDIDVNIKSYADNNQVSALSSPHHPPSRTRNSFSISLQGPRVPPRAAG